MITRNPYTIIQVTAYYPPHLGGLERVVQEVAEQLARNGHRVTVLTSNVGAKDVAPMQTKGNLTVNYLWAFDFAHTAFIPSLFFHLWRVEKPAVFHLHLAQAYVPEMVWLVSKLRGIPYIVHFHLDVEPSGRLGFLYVLWKKWVQTIIIKDAARVITLSPAQSALIEERHHKAPNTVVFIGNGVSEKFLGIGRVKRIVHKPLRLLFVGRLAIQKRPERLVKSLSLITSDVTLDLVGDGEDRAALEAIAQKLNIKNLMFRGRLDGEELLDAYRNADVFVLASDREGMPLVLLEAMATGLPIVGSDVLGITELISGIGVLVKNPSPETFAKAIDGIANDPEALSALSAASAKTAEHHSWEKLVEKLEAVYKELIP